MGYIVGRDALDIARMTGLQLHRVPTRRGEKPDTDISVADALIASGQHITENDFFLDTADWTAKDAHDVTESLIGLYKATLDNDEARRLYYTAE